MLGNNFLHNTGQMAKELKRIPIDANSFLANGTKYIIHPSLSVERYRHFQRLQVIGGFGSDYQTLYRAVSGAYDLLNKGKFADAAVKLNGLLEGIGRETSGQEDPFLLLCTLFVAKQGADLERWSEAEAQDCISDWKDEGYDVADFFKLALRLVRDLHNALAQDSRNISE